MEVDDFCAVENKAWWELWPAESHAMVQSALAEARAGHVAHFVARCPTAKGRECWWDVSVAPVFDRQHTVTSLIAVSRDITTAKRDHDAMEIIALEMRHRLKNAFAISGAIAKAAARDKPDAKPFADGLARRFMVLAEAQGKILDSLGRVTLDVFMSELIKKFETIHGTVSVGEIPKIKLDEGTMRVVALVLGELGNNSVKYGALGGSGSVSLAAKVQNNRLVVNWHETFSPDAQPTMLNPASDGSGFGLMTRMAKSAGGEFVRAFSSGGLVATLEIPVAQ